MSILANRSTVSCRSNVDVRFRASVLASVRVGNLLHAPTLCAEMKAFSSRASHRIARLGVFVWRLLATAFFFALLGSK